MGKTAYSTATLRKHPEMMAAATRYIADKSRFGVLYYLVGLLGIFAIAPQLDLGSQAFALLFAAFVGLATLREYAYRFSLHSDHRLRWSQRCIEASYPLNAVVWAIFSFLVLESERDLSGPAAATVITSAGLTAGGVTAIVPHLALIRQYAALMMGSTSVMLPLLIPGAASWYVCFMCLIYVVFLFGLGRRQCDTHWQLVESNRNLQRQTEALIEARREAVAGARAKSEFLANMSHEIRTPMNGVIGMAQLLEKTPLNAQQTTYLQIIQDAGTTLLTIIDDVLDFSKLEAKKMTLNPEPVDLDALVRNLQTLFAIQLQNAAVQLRYERSTDLPSWVLADAARVRQLLYNLIGNAIKFTPAGSITVKLDYLATAPDRGRVRFSVTDTGIGIAAEAHSQVFAKFEQIGSARSTKGTGLGLAISKHLVELMGGEIGFESTLGVGSNFWFELPLQSVDAPANVSNAAAQTAGELHCGDVLLVEDNETNQVVAQGMLEHCGCIVQCVNSGEEAISAVKRKEFSLILMDCDMPGIDGFAATRIIRDWETQQQRRRTAIVALTAHVLENARQQCREAGMDDYLAKPLNFDELQAMIQRWSAQSKAV